jgi:hypothetical protein
MTKPEQIFSQSDERYLDDDTPIWRYVPLRSLFFYLNGLIFIPSVAKLKAGDPFEGKSHDDIAWFNQAFLDRYGDKADGLDKWMLAKLCSDAERHVIDINKTNAGGSPAPLYLRRHYFDFIMQTRFAWCWFHSQRESAAMWSVYGNQGVAIKTTVGRIKALFESSGRKFIYGRMTYVDYENGHDFDPSILNYQLLLRPYFLKRKEYESENEVRFVTAASERGERGGILTKGLLLDWITAIRLWPGLTVDEEKSLCKAVRHFIPTVDCERSGLFAGPDNSGLIEQFGFDIERSADSEWEAGSDGIPLAIKVL